MIRSLSCPAVITQRSLPLCTAAAMSCLPASLETIRQNQITETRQRLVSDQRRASIA